MQTLVTAAGATLLMRSRIALLLHDPRVAARVRRGLDRAAEAAAAEVPGTPACFRAAGGPARAPFLVKGGRCRALCGSIDCLCGAYPASLSDEEIAHGRQFEPLAR